MKRFSTIVALMMVGAFMVGLLAAPVNAQTATAPTWHVGDSWAMGKELDLGKDVTDNLVDIKTAVLTMTNLTVDDLTVDSKASAYAMFTVLSETDTSFAVEAKVAIKFATQADVSVTGMMPKADTYDDSISVFSPASTVPKEMKTISVDLNEKLGMILTATLTVDKTTFAVEKADWKMLSAMSFGVVAKNIPEVNKTGFFGTTQTVTYKDYDIGMDMVAELNLSAVFEPELVIYEFPFSPGDIWYTSASMATVNGDVSGFLDAHGLTAEQKEQIFTEELRNATGATDFPISFDHLNSEDGMITDSKFGPFYGNTTATKLECFEAVTMTFGDAELDVFKIYVGERDNVMYYSPGFKMFGIAPDPADLPSGVDTAMSFLGEDDVNMEPVATTKASAEISAIETYTKNLASETAGSNGIGDFFFKAPFLGIILIVAAVVIVTTVIIYTKKARKP